MDWIAPASFTPPAALTPDHALEGRRCLWLTEHAQGGIEAWQLRNEVPASSSPLKRRALVNEKTKRVPDVQDWADCRRQPGKKMLEMLHLPTYHMLTVPYFHP
jgi:hypothetical protein